MDQKFYDYAATRPTSPYSAGIIRTKIVSAFAPTKLGNRSQAGGRELDDWIMARYRARRLTEGE